MEHNCTQNARIAEIKTTNLLNQKFMEDKFDHLEKKLDDVITMIWWLDTKYDNKYASKFVEKRFIWLISLVWAIIVGGLMRLIFKS